MTILSQIFALLLLMPDWPQHLQMVAISAATVIALTRVVLPAHGGGEFRPDGFFLVLEIEEGMRPFFAVERGAG